MIAGTLTSKGQVTIPSKARKALGLKAGDRLLFEVLDNELRIRPVHHRRASELYGAFKATRQHPGTDNGNAA